MGCTCASVITAEMTDWTRLGGGNSGCCGNALHTYGFHLPANALPATDYSRRYDLNPPVDWNYACAGDFGHHGDPTLRDRHAQILARLMRGELPMICEFIGQPWSGRPVYYWARWSGIGTLQRYLGQGHDTWSHISWWRSRANERAHLYTADPNPIPNITPAGHHYGTAAPLYPGHLMTPSGAYNANVRMWQAQMASRGWRITADGRFGPKTNSILRQFQAEKHLGIDGILGPASWGAAWTSPVT